MSFLSVLKAIGKGVGRGLMFLGQNAGALAPIAGKFGVILDKVAFGVTSVEGAVAILGVAKTGPEKLAAALAVINQALRDGEVLSGVDIVDNVKWERGLASLASGTADVLDSIKHK